LRVRRFAVGASLLGAVAVLISACGSSSSSSSSGGSCVSGKTLTIYSSLPFDPTDKPQSQDVVDGEKLALQQAGNKAGKYNIKYVSLDDATPAEGKWEAGQTSSNARTAAQNANTILYLGEFNSGATAVSLPILNRSGILQISPSNTAVGLTKKSADPAEPAKYYPTGKRTYGRVVPADNIQSAAQVSYMKSLGVKKLYVLDDKEVYGKGVGDGVAADAKKAGIVVAGDEGIDPKAANYRSLAQKIKSSGADAFFFGGITANNAVQLWGDVFAANPNIKGFGPDGVAETAFSSKIPASTMPNTYITNPTLPPKLYPPAAQKFFNDFQSTYGHQPEPYAIYGYSAMGAALQAIKNAGDKGNCRSDVIKGFFAIKNQPSALGTYSIDPDGDTTITDYGGNTIKAGKLTFDKVIKAQNTTS
jgi:branched-chain amino acid transport system substrate-binding protein